MKNTVIVGLGAISKNHLNPVKNIGCLYGVCDIVSEKTKAISEEFSCKAYNSFDDVIADENVDCIHILTPHFLHFQMAKKASEAGETVVLEKPAVMNMKEFEQLTEIFKKNNTKNLIVLQNRYNPCIVYLKENFNNLTNELGNFLGSKGILTWYRDEAYYNRSDWRGKYKTEGGGVLINQAPHIIDLLLYFGGQTKRFEGHSSLRSLKGIIEVEDTCEAMIDFENGTRSIFYVTNGYVTNSPYDIEFVFENGTVRYIYGGLIKSDKDGITQLCEDEHITGEKKYWGKSHEIILKKFYGGEVCPSLEDYRQTCEVIETLVNTKGRN